MVEAKEYKLSVTSCISWILLAIITATISITLLCKYPAWDSKKKDSNSRPNKPRHEKWFYVWLIGLSTLGGFWALFLPLALSQKFDGPNADGNQLRLHLLYITGGVLALTTLGETHRKNTLEKHKNDQDHTRQVHAERRSRYTAAIEQLSSDKASIRLGGIYSLVGLVDEWLADEKTIPDLEERRKEGQVIINNLCAYIRSPFDLVSKIKELSESTDVSKDYSDGTQQFIKAQSMFREEQEMRQTILSEINKRLNGGTHIIEGGTRKILKGMWSDFNYDFSSTVFFYPTNFSDSFFRASSIFSGATFNDNANFFGVAFNDYADFRGATFNDNANFREATFNDYADFRGATFNDNANFSETRFTDYAQFSEAEFTGSTDFFGAEFTGTNFGWAKFTGDANFSEAKFTGIIFSEAKFTGSANFSEAKFTGSTDFFGAEFTGDANFSGATFEERPTFRFAIDNKTCKARFSCKADPEDYNFKVSHDSPYTIETEEQEHNGVKFIIPKGTELFDPDEPSDLEDDDES
ncbi:pentapeptide repeat-containing protein [Rothia aeria]|uniref:pentapeptide repeat-containing protein n=1 Tax=Rothia aeria TaxID=172042 RepID=UPI001E6057D1|nr:pentapeptide repeat-containing protein [Rothia aeria]